MTPDDPQYLRETSMRDGSSRPSSGMLPGTRLRAKRNLTSATGLPSRQREPNGTISDPPVGSILQDSGMTSKKAGFSMSYEGLGLQRTSSSSESSPQHAETVAQQAPTSRDLQDHEEDTRGSADELEKEEIKQIGSFPDMFSDFSSLCSHSDEDPSNDHKKEILDGTEMFDTSFQWSLSTAAEEMASTPIPAPLSQTSRGTEQTNLEGKEIEQDSGQGSREHLENDVQSPQDLTSTAVQHQETSQVLLNESIQAEDQAPTPAERDPVDSNTVSESLAPRSEYRTDFQPSRRSTLMERLRTPFRRQRQTSVNVKSEKPSLVSPNPPESPQRVIPEPPIPSVLLSTAKNAWFHMEKKWMHLLESVSQLADSEKEEQLKSSASWQAIKQHIASLLQETHSLTLPSSGSSDRGDGYVDLNEKSKFMFLDLMQVVQHKARKVKFDQEQLRIWRTHESSHILQQLKETESELLHLLDLKTTSHQEEFSPLSTGMQQLERESLATVYPLQEIDLATEKSAALAKIEDLERVRKTSEDRIEALKCEEMELRLKLTEATSQLQNIQRARSEEEQRHQIASKAAARVEYACLRINKETQNAAEELQQLYRQIHKSQKAARRRWVSDLDALRQHQEQLISAAATDLSSLRETKDRWISEMESLRTQWLHEQASAQSALTAERSRLDEEYAAKERAFRESCLQKEASLAEMASTLRAEVSEWVTLKEDINQRQRHLGELHKHLTEQNQIQKKEQKWLLHKQKEVKMALEENKRLMSTIQKDMGIKRSLVETCRMLKRQIELTVQFHQERGAIIDVIYWDSKRGKAWIPSSGPTQKLPIERLKEDSLTALHSPFST